jgi:hypothetical protein
MVSEGGVTDPAATLLWVDLATEAPCLNDPMLSWSHFCLC